MPVRRPGAGEVGYLGPLLPAELVVGDTQRHRPVAGHDGPMPDTEPSPRHAFRGAHDLVGDHVRVHGRGGPADRRSLDPAHVRRRGVERLALFWLQHTRPDPAGADLLDDRRDVTGREVDDDVAVPVQAPGRVAVQVAGFPGGARPGFPGERRPGRIHAHTLDRAGEAKAQRVGRGGVAETDEEEVARRGLILEGEEVAAVQRLGGPVGMLLPVRGRERRRHRDGHDREVIEGREDDRLVGLGADGRGLGAARDAQRVRLRAGQPERDVAARGRRREQPDPDQLEELHVVAVGDAVDAVEELVGHPREELDQGHARVGHVVVRPLRAALLDQALGVVDEVLEAAIVQVGDRQGHRAHSSAGIT